MCKFFEVSRSGYYDYVKRIGNPDKDADLAEEIRMCQRSADNTYEYGRVWLWLAHRKIHRNPKTVLRVMKKYGLLSEIRRRRKWVNLGQQMHKYDNLLKRQFRADRPNAKWVTDISYIHTKEGILYLSMIRDLYDNSIVAYKTASRQTVNLVLDTIRLAMRYQYCDGHTVRSWKPLDETYYSDGQIWLVLATCDYFKYSGDIAFLDEEIPYFDKGKGSVLEHLEMGVTRLNEDRGPNNLCLIRFADWNDALNLCDEKAESTFTSMGLAWCAKELSSLFEYLKKQAAADKYKKIFEDIKHIINEKCWDSEGYYIRGFSNGKKIGASESEGSKIYVNPQSWAILSEVATEERIPQILDAVEKYLETDLGYLVNYPAYQHYDKELGRISFQVPGTTENGAVYCHATGFKINADVKLGSGSKALESIRKIMPDSDCNPSVHSGALPYALTSCYCTHPVIYGKAGRPWLTGTQGWLFNCVIEGLLGIKKTYGGFLIRPSFPEEWENAQCSIQKENTTYNFKLKRTGKNKIEVNGEETGCFIPFCNDEAVCIDIQI
jgi:cellobiose phosphorylase